MKDAFIRAFGAFGLTLFLFGAVAGVFDLSGVFSWAVYSQLALGLALILTYLIVHSKDVWRTLASNQETLFGGIGGLFFLFILIGVNVFAHSEFGERRFDTTANKVHSLSQETKQIIRNLQSPVEVISFVTAPNVRIGLRNVMKNYRAESNQLTFRELDPDHEPKLLQRFEAQPNTIVFYNPEREHHSVLPANRFSEHELTLGIHRVASGETSIVYFLTGQGEPDTEDQGNLGLLFARVFMEREGYVVRQLDLNQERRVPEDAELVLAIGATSPVSETVSDALRVYLNQGGRMILAVQPIIAPTQDAILETGYEDLLQDFGLAIEPGIILEEAYNQGRFQLIPSALGAELASHPILEKMSEQQDVMFPLRLAQPIRKLETDDQIQSVALISTTAQSILSRDIKELLTQQSSITDERGPFSLMQLATKTSETDRLARLLVVGNASYIMNRDIARPHFRDLVMNSLNYMTDQEKSLHIRPRSFRTSTLEITESQHRRAYFASLFVFPQIIILFGLGVWAIRRSRQ